MIARGALPFAAFADAYSVSAPAVVIRPIFAALYSVNHSAPSGPLVITEGFELAWDSAKSVSTPASV